jgi:hypothetical protein
MKYVETDFNHISILDDIAVLIEAIDGVDICAEKAKYANDLIEKEMPANYGLIIDRKADYSIVPVEVYNALNKYERLKAIAIVLQNKRNFLPVTTEKKLFKGQLEVFKTIKEAHAWITGVITESS